MRVAVIGAGLIGSAAARHLALAGHEVVLIGPPEPDEKRAHQGVFASHYDEGRITRKNATQAFWAKVSKASIARYPEIEAAGGQFFTPVGAVMAGPQDGSFMRRARAVSEELGTDCTLLNPPALREAFPYFAFSEDTAALYEPQDAGHISPRQLVAAQQRAARANGTQFIAQAVLAVEAHASGVVVRTAQGELQAEAALIASGAMTDTLSPRKLGLQVFARTVALFEIGPAEAARLSGMPSLVLREAGSTAEPYLLPPIRYPDGRVYLKLGGDPVDRQLFGAGEIGDWFRSGGDAGVRDFLEVQVRRLMPGLTIASVRMDACVTAMTPSGRPVIDWVDERIAVASGGNGAGAKCSDELGRLGAVLVSGGTDTMLAQTQLAAG